MSSGGVCAVRRDCDCDCVCDGAVWSRKSPLAADDGHERLPPGLHLRREVGHQLAVGPDQPGRVLGPLDVARRPVDAVGDA